MVFPPKVEIIFAYDKNLTKAILNHPYLDELDAINRLMRYSLSFEDIDKTMIELMGNRWTGQNKEKQEQYYNNGKEENRKRTKNPLIQYFELKIKKIELYPNKNDSMLKIILEDAKIQLPKDKIITSREFRTLYYLESQGTLLPELSQNVWAKLLTLWTKKYGKIIIKKEVTEEELIAEKILSELETFSLVEDIKKCLSYGRAYFENDQVFIPSSAIELIIQKNKWNYKLTKIAFFLEKFLADRSEPKRVGPKRIVRFWKFKKEALNMDYENLILKGEENEEN